MKNSGTKGQRNSGTEGQRDRGSERERDRGREGLIDYLTVFTLHK